jgi:hypothetical protein
LIHCKSNRVQDLLPLLPELLAAIFPKPLGVRLRVLAPNKSLQRSGTHKVLGRGRPSRSAHERWRARVLKGRCGR